ncbi:hypothetical protein EYF80_023345 [Liparis tanakae]|uniref:Secreted protein n=1 Tax=Liparis tanakae TaxID=230148 RepID=A0A4Z2HL43_9TELE|nr:hypothetical protein EYF80_023345 [Liparis tanakae]
MKLKGGRALFTCTLLVTMLIATHLQSDRSHHDQDAEERHAPDPAQVHVIEDEEARPAQFLERVRRVAHAVHPLHVQLLDETSAHVAQLVKAELPVVAAHTAVSCPGKQSETGDAQVTVLVDVAGALAAQLQGDRRQVLGSCLHDEFPHHAVAGVEDMIKPLTQQLLGLRHAPGHHRSGSRSSMAFAV